LRLAQFSRPSGICNSKSQGCQAATSLTSVCQPPANWVGWADFKPQFISALNPILVSCSNAIYACSQQEPPRLLLPRPDSFWPWGKRELGFFGLCQGLAADQVLIGSRVRLGTAVVEKKATDSRIYSLTLAGQAMALFDYKDCHDLHQIDQWRGHLLLTDTGKNRVHLVEIATGNPVWRLNFGQERRDISHINAVTVEGDQVWVCLNNKGHRPTQIARFDLNALFHLNQPELDAASLGTFQSLGEIMHVHDLEQVQGEFLFSCSRESEVRRLKDLSLYVKLQGWVRGLAQDGDGLWIGESIMADRSKRHAKNADGRLHYLPFGETRPRLSYLLPHCGQVNDVICLPGT